MSRPTPRFIIHPGAHKTGTTAIQACLGGNAKVLRNAGIALLRQVRPALGRPRLDPAAASAVRDLFEATLKEERAEQVVVSYEALFGPEPIEQGRAGLYPSYPESIKALGTTVAGAPTLIVYAIRDQADLIESWYVQTVKTGDAWRFEEYAKGLAFSSYRWWPIIDALRNEFGPSRVVVLDYTRIAAERRDLRRIFASTFTDADALDYPEENKVRNQSYSGRGVEIALAARPFLETGDEVRALRRFLQNHFPAANGQRPTFLSAEQRQALSAIYAEDIAAISASGVTML